MKMNRRAFITRSCALVAPFGMAGGMAPTLEAASPLANEKKAIFNVYQYGAKGDGQTKDTRAIQAAINAAGSAGGTVLLPPGNFLSGTLRLKSHLAVRIEAGATLIASPGDADFDPYEHLDYNSFADLETTDFNFALMQGRDIEDLSLFGPGRIEGNRKKRGGPKPVALKNCRRIIIRDLAIANAPNYNLSLLGCDEVDILGVTILNGYCDGIDPDCCRNVRIANCYVECWDDAIVPKASFALGLRRATENLTVTNCVLSTACNALKLGTESSGDFKNIAFNNCAIFARPDLWHREPTSGLSLEMVDGGTLQGVVVSNLTMRDVRAPIFVRLGNRGRSQAMPEPRALQDVSICNIVATGASWASSIMGLPGHPIRQISLNNIRITARGGGPAEWASRVVAEQERDYPDADRFGNLPASGLYCRHVENLLLDDIHLQLAKEDFRPALILDDVNEADLRNILAAPPAGAEPALWLRSVRNSLIQGTRARPETKVFLKVTGEPTARLRAVGNDFSAAEKPVVLGLEVRSGAWHMD